MSLAEAPARPAVDWNVVFAPRSVAVAGASARPDTPGNDYVRCLQDCGFESPIYPVHPRAEEVNGLRGYASVRDIEGPVDYVISCVPTEAAYSLLEDCIARDVKVIQFFTARFSETGHADAAELERKIFQRASEAGIRIIGPNCMGLYVPATGLSFRVDFKPAPGGVAFLSQSGSMAIELIYQAFPRGVRFSKVVSYGNGLDLNAIDFLDYLAADDETKVIAVYIEGVGDGRAFFARLREAARRKPVVVLKGGRTEAGTRSAQSHTAALAGQRQVWSTVIKQAGAVEVASLDDLIDAMVGFSCFPPATGRNVGVVGGGGGRAVQSADACEEAGLSVIPLTEGIRGELRERVPDIWDWLQNPVDQSILGGYKLGGTDLLAMMGNDPDFHVLIANLGEDWLLGRPTGADLVRHVARRFTEIGSKIPKPVAVVIGHADQPEEWRWKAITDARDIVAEAGVAVYPSVFRAARALALCGDYWRRREPA
ncbi:MAG: CoA-binding protein [Dehalococcoidia bacterium]